MKLRFVQVDAFADRPFAGNPAAVMPLDRWLDDPTLQAIAQENNLAETAFLVPTEGDADYELRWFTPTVEVVLCGHATLASGHVLLGDRPELDSVRFRTRKSGILAVTRTGEGYALDLPAWTMAPTPLPATVAAMGGAPAETLAREGGYQLLVYASEAEILALRPDFRALATQGDVLFVATAPGNESDIVSRVFVPGAGRHRFRSLAPRAVLGSAAGAGQLLRLSGLRARRETRLSVGGRPGGAGREMRDSDRGVVRAVDDQAASSTSIVSAIQPPPSTRSPA
jgi:predicted PhzF superfamily epimerase YddE/YHI9